MFRTKGQFCILFIMIFCSSFLVAQDVQLSQFYANPLHLNAGFAGGNHSPRFTMHQRIQWPSLQAKYITSLISYDHYFSEYNSGVGIQIIQDFRGANTISSTDINLMYSYELQATEKLTFRPGLQVGLGTRNLNYASLSFPSQFDNTGKISDTPETFLGDSRVWYPDISAGLIAYTEDFWIGLSTFHLNQPDQSILNADDKLPIKGILVGGYKINLANKKTNKSTVENHKEIYFTPTFHYKWQGKADQFDLGTYFMYDFVIAGFWYRGIPFKRYINKEENESFHNNESMVFVLGTKLRNWKITYSFDWTISTLHDGRPGGAHEVNLTYTYKKVYKRKKPMKRLPCPKFLDY